MNYSTSNHKAPIHTLHILVILLITAVYSWPLLRQLTVAIPGKFELTDTTETIWSIGWVYQALSRGESVWHTDRLFVPYGADLRFNVFGLLQGVMAFPFVASFGTVGASNLVILFTMFLNGVFAYLLVWRHTDHPTAALLASVCHILSPAVVWHFSAGRNALPALWIVSASWLSLRTLLDKPAMWKGILLGCSLLAAFFTDLQVAVFTYMWVLFYMVAYFWKNSFMKSWRNLFPALLIAVLMLVFAFSVVLLPVLPELRRGDYSTPSLNDAAYYAFSIEEFISPQTIPFIYGFDFLVSVILAIILFGRQGAYGFWLLGTLIFLILSLGPYLKPTHIPLPYTLASIWPPLLNFRATYRFVIPATLGLTLVMGYVLTDLLSKVLARGLVSLVCLIFILLRLWYTMQIQPFETQIYPIYDFYYAIAGDSEDYAIIEIPFGIRSGFDQVGQGGERMQYYQHIHRKRILSGSVARLPNSLFIFYRKHPVLLFFSGNMSVDRSKLRDDFSDILGWASPKYILVHRSLISAQQSAEIELFLGSQPQIQKIDTEDDLVIYQTIP